MGDVIPFERPNSQIEYEDSTTIVECIELTDEIKAEFEKHGYTFDDNPEDAA